MTAILNFIRALMGLAFTMLLGPSGHRRKPGFASVRFGRSITVEGDIRKMRIQNDEEFDVKLAPKDIHGNLTSEYEQGSERFYVKDGDPSLVQILDLKGSGHIGWATIRATGLNGVVQLAASVDGDPGDGADIIEQTMALEIVSSRARTIELMAGSDVRKQAVATEAVVDTGSAPSSPPPPEPESASQSKQVAVDLKVPETEVESSGTQPEKTVVVGDEPSKFPLMGGAQIADAPLREPETAAQPETEQLAQSPNPPPLD